MNIHFGFIVEVGTEMLMRFRVFFSFSYYWMGKSDLFKAKEETRRTTTPSKKNFKTFPKN